MNRIFIDGYGLCGEAITKKIVENHKIDKENVLVFTYSRTENESYLKYLKLNGIAFFTGSYKQEKSLNKIKKFSPNIIVSLFGRRIIPKSILDLAIKGSFNLHPSLLPDYKGCFSAPWVIINEEKYTGITIHEITPEIDAGGILYQKRIELIGNETGYSLYHRLLSEFISVFDGFFRSFIEGRLLPKQMPSGGKYYTRSVPYDGIIQSNWSLKKIDAFIRAMFFPPFKGALLEINKDLKECSTIEDYKHFIINCAID